jgi:hypothetical protein
MTALAHVTARIKDFSRKNIWLKSRGDYVASNNGKKANALGKGSEEKLLF